MSKLDNLTEAAQALPSEQLDALIDLAKAMRAPPFIERAPPEAITSLEQGLEEIAAGQSVDGAAVFDRLGQKLRARGV